MGIDMMAQDCRHLKRNSETSTLRSFAYANIRWLQVTVTGGFDILIDRSGLPIVRLTSILSHDFGVTRARRF
jgi:hypothetical protein